MAGRALILHRDALDHRLRRHHPVSAHARLLNVLIVTPLRLLFLIVLVGTTIEVLTKRTRQAIRTKLWRQRVPDHVIVVGYGVKGASAMKAIV